MPSFSQHEPSKPHDLAVVLASGGMDSLVTTAMAAQHYRLAMLHADYGQRTEGRERRAFEEIAKYYAAEKQLVVDMAHFRQIGGSSLTDQSLPVRQSGLTAEGIPTSYVPFRNANILSVAVSWAEVIGARKIFIGAVWEDSSGYPDCRPIFYEAFNQLIKTGTRPETQIEVVTPLIHMTKADIVRKGVELGAPFHLSWSCYQSEEKACGRCDSCRLRLKGFKNADVTDPIPYETLDI